MCFLLSVKMKNNLVTILVDDDSQDIHASDLRTDFCKCVAKIIRKSVDVKDYIEIGQTYGCYECDWSTY